MDEPGHGSSYGAVGVDYEVLDAGKRRALDAALATSGLLVARGGRAIDASRGEPAFVFELAGQTLAFVLEGLGTKSMIARAMEPLLGPRGYAAVAYDTVAAIVNDLCCVGAVPLVVNAYFATGASEWYADAARQQALLDGWQQACADCGAAWGGGESPSLPGLVAGEEIELAGSAVGVVPAGHAPILGAELAPGDEIVIVRSSGLHANGATLARSIAAGLPDGYATLLLGAASPPVGFGEALLAPSILYAPLVAALLAAAEPVHYLSHITGHGLLKLMRPGRDLAYRLDRLPPVPPVLDFMVTATGMSAAEAYSTFNMGCGFAVYCAAGAGADVVAHASRLGLVAEVSGVVEPGPRRVLLAPVGVTFEGARLDLAPGAATPAPPG